MSIWIAYYDDWSSFALFVTEIDALRFAVGRTMIVKEITLPCERVREAVNK